MIAERETSDLIDFLSRCQSPTSAEQPSSTFHEPGRIYRTNSGKLYRRIFPDRGEQATASEETSFSLVSFSSLAVQLPHRMIDDNVSK